ncbi:hypothetical protein CLV84_0267 [Neolewinella xylanilytica]|uniref:Uncharacterized protein n=1 Tax=Neolewinella xylanilytica TaxID=1514080 RepID=A0A2S6I775_9BACT|nr:hypothetical protein [Neolewinella xylanilytica]PPK87328.1 hypothetical protein CLV84_0267 [Neolewinella xylanilytica]
MTTEEKKARIFDWVCQENQKTPNRVFDNLVSIARIAGLDATEVQQILSYLVDEGLIQPNKGTSDGTFIRFTNAGQIICDQGGYSAYLDRIYKEKNRQEERFELEIQKLRGEVEAQKRALENKIIENQSAVFKSTRTNHIWTRIISIIALIISAITLAKTLNWL